MLRLRDAVLYAPSENNLPYTIPKAGCIIWYQICDSDSPV